MAIKKLWSPQNLPYVFYAGLALCVLLPLLLPGHILTLDMAFTPRIPMPDHVTSSYLFRLLLHSLNVVVPTPIIEKILFFVILFGSGIGMHRLAAHVDSAESKFAYYASGALYMINPFTYSRFMAGQYSVLLGYALLPFFASALLAFINKPARHTMFRLVLWALGISVVSIHTIGLAAVLAVVAMCAALWRNRAQKPQLKQLAAYSAIGSVAFVLASSYWLAPFLLGKGETAQTISRFGVSDSQAFATLGDNALEQAFHVLRLQGFWVEDRQLYAPPQDQFPGWGLVVLCLWAFVAIGSRALWRRRKRFETAFFAIAAGIAFLASLSAVGGWLASHVWFLEGYREPHKFAGLVALAYALFAGTGAAQIMRACRRRWQDNGIYASVTIIVLAYVLLTPSMFWGFGGQLSPRQYPSDWFAMNDQLKRDKADFQVLFLPWHLYMHFGFAGRIIANPAPDFFDQLVIVSNNPEFADVSPTDNDPNKAHLEHKLLPRARQGEDIGKGLAYMGVKYVLLAKEADASEYDFLNQQKKLTLVKETATLKLYRNDAFER